MPEPNDTTTKKEQELNEELKQQEQREKAYFENVGKRVADTAGIHKKYDTNRYTKKAQMSQLIATWREELKGDNEVLQDKTLANLLKDMEDYAAMDITATHSTTVGNVENVRRELYEVEKSVKAESKKISNLAKNVQKYISELETKSAEMQGEKEETLIAIRQIMAQNIRLLIEEQINGYLPEVPDDAHHIKAKDKDIVTAERDSFINHRDMPLFPHDPSPSDIKQGYLGDCYMVSVLANIAKTDPDKIKEAVRDNGDGTVTVRLFQSTVPKYQDYFATDAKPPSQMEPFYVTVDKTVPSYTAARNCLWAAMIEKAVVASGLSVSKRYSGTYARPVPDNIEELYEKYKNMREEQRPSKIECPWLFDKNNNLVKWKADYAQIESGHSQMFTESFLGEGYEAVKEDFDPTRTDAARDVIYDFLMMQVGKATNPSYEEKARKILESRGDASQRLRNATRLLRGIKNQDVGLWYTPSFTATGELERLDKISHDSDRSYQGFVEAIVNPLSGCLLEGSIKYPDGNFAAAVVTTIEKAIDDKLKEHKYNTKEENTIKGLREAFKQNQEQILSGISGRKYPISYEKKFEEIKNELAAGHIVAAASMQSPKKDEDLKGGIFYSHAYNVIGTEEEVIDGKNYKFVVMRNPHGSDKVPVYDYSKIPPKATNGLVPEAQGVFKMELSHFVSNLDYLTINGKVMSEQEKKASDRMKLGFIQQNILGKYDRVFTEVDKNLAKALKEDPDNQTDIQELRNRIQEKLLAKEDVTIDAGDYRAFSVQAKEILGKNSKLNPVTRRIIEAAAEFAGMYVNKIIDPMAEIAKDKTMNNLGEFRRKDSFYDGSKLEEKLHKYAAKKREMLKKKENFERQKTRREDVKNELLKVYTKEEINNLISDYEAEENKIREYSDTWNKCIDAKFQAQSRIKTIDANVSQYARKLGTLSDENEKADKAVERLKECLKKYEDKQKESSNLDQDTQIEKKNLQNELNEKEKELTSAKKHFDSLVKSMAKKPEEKEYIQIRLYGIENPSAWIDEDRLDDLKFMINPKDLEKWNRRLQAVAEKQDAYFAKKDELDKLQEESIGFEDNDIQTAMIEEAFAFEAGEFNPLASVDVSDYVTEAKEYISNVENGRFKRKKELDDLKKLYNDTVKEQKKVEAKLEQIESKEKVTKNTLDKLRNEHKAKENSYKSLKEARDSYNAAFKEAFEKTGELGALDLQEDIKRIAGEFLDKQNLNASGHTNSPEFNRMLRGLNILKSWPEIDEVCMDMPENEKPTSLEDALGYLKKQAEDYKKAKNQQIHIFKTAIYKTRISMADSIIDFAKTTKKDMAIVNEAERKELNAYFENKGRDNGELKAEKNKIEVKVTKDTKQINAPEVENELDSF